MKLMICGSMHFSKEMLETKSSLEKLGHEAMVSPDIKECLENPDLNMDLNHCIETNIDKKCFNQIAESDGIVVLNYDKNNIKRYVGGATLMEIGLARHLDKKIFLLFDYPEEKDLRYSLEIKLAQPTVLNGDLNKIN